MPTERSPLISNRASCGSTSSGGRETSGTQSESASGYFYKACHEINTIMLSSHLHWLLAIVPFAVTAATCSWSPITVFATNFFAIMPLSAVLSFATERVSMNLGAEPKALLRATSRNAVEFVMGILALKNDHFGFGRSIVLGSILYNLLSNMGMCFFLGGIANMRDRVTNQGTEQSFPPSTAQIICTVMAVPMTTVAMSAALSSAFGDEDPAKRDQSVLVLSRGAAIVFLVLYITYHCFKCRTHSDLFRDETQPDETEESVVSFLTAAAILTVAVVLIIICAGNLVGSSKTVAEAAHVGLDLIGFVFVPIAANAAKQSAAVAMAMRDRMDLAMDIILNSITQTGLLIYPGLIVLAWALFNKPMTLQFELVTTVVCGLATLAVALVVKDGKSNHLEGALLLGLYAIIVLALYFSPLGGGGV